MPKPLTITTPGDRDIVVVAVALGPGLVCKVDGRTDDAAARSGEVVGEDDHGSGGRCDQACERSDYATESSHRPGPAARREGQADPGDERVMTNDGHLGFHELPPVLLTASSHGRIRNVRRP